MAAEEEIDNETLQAQIDLSLSFAQNLVSSWVKPSLKPTKSSSRSFDAELKEYMRRPPRLGVGAAIPEAAVSSRDTEKLKSHLKKGGKRVREDEDDTAKQLSDNEAESRGASVKKKARIDPFEANKKKKKKGIEGDVAPAVVTPPPPEPVAPAEEAKPSEDPSSPTSKRRKKKKHKNKDAPDSAASLPGPSTAPPESPVKSSTVEVPDSPRPSYVISSSPPTSPSAQRLKLQSALLKGPILNLTGPPADDEEESGGEGSPEASQKKKRKRKKKKKSMGARQEQPV
ncbi:hypothetical protein FB45DRAFT_904539 [Roridomyces roridus]|uniref:Uncharacterized protein n=1 Tax=Roridomyces roridus TaxID=1738132 RepID=A0AAD7C531_9AGAR|nr:hypothetical protein FB45DRAFT_904539 [Roridomyces roridus]